MIPIQWSRTQRQIRTAEQFIKPDWLEYAKECLNNGLNRYAVMRHLRDDGPMCPSLAIATVLKAEKL